MSGICIIVTGRTGAGKTTLVKECVLEPSFNMEYMTSYVTRPPREGDFGYVYLTKEEYAKKRESSKSWDHFEFFGEYYGTDVEELIEKVTLGKNIIMTTYPSMEELLKIKSVYKVPLATIFIDIPRELSIKRMTGERQGDELERLKKDDEAITPEVLGAYDHIFRATKTFEENKIEFKQLVNFLLHQ